MSSSLEVLKYTHFTAGYTDTRPQKPSSLRPQSYCRLSKSRRNYSERLANVKFSITMRPMLRVVPSAACPVSIELAAVLSQATWCLDEAALTVFKVEDPDFDSGFYLHKFKQLAMEFERRLPSKRQLGAMAQAFIQFMATENGFRGDEENYFDPDNVYLHRVLERRKGMPLSLSIIYIEVARRVGLSILGVGLPGHFLIQIEGQALYIDPFYSGDVLTEEGCRARFHRIYGRDAHFDSHFLKPVHKTQILARFINNLKGIYVRKQDPSKAIQLINLYLVLYPDANPEILERGLLYRQLECFNPALRDFESYLNSLPDDGSTVEERQKILQEIAALKRLTLNFH